MAPREISGIRERLPRRLAVLIFFVSCARPALKKLIATAGSAGSGRIFLCRFVPIDRLREFVPA